MSQILTVKLSDVTYSALQQQAAVTGASAAELAAATLEQRYGSSNASCASRTPMSEEEKQTARQRFERHFGSLNLGYATGVDNEAIDRDLARTYADAHESE